MSASASEYLHSWNRPQPAFASVQIEHDIRDALQSPSVRQPSISERCALLDLEHDVGIDFSFVGFPASSTEEAERCERIVAHVDRNGLRSRPVLMARASVTDIDAIAAVRDRTGVSTLVDLYVPLSRLRLHVEGWQLSHLIERLLRAGEVAAARGLEIRVAFEDSTRAHPQDLDEAIDASLAITPTSVVVNDTAGDCLPSGAAAHTAHVVERLRTLDANIPVAWHGHNDRGLALANALAAVDAGATIVSGTLLGIGERVGNVPIEQCMVVAAMHGSQRFTAALLPMLCRSFALALDVPLVPGAPLVGGDAFATATGTHVSALVKARELGDSFEHLVYSGVDARILGRDQEVHVGPHSGRAAAREALRRADLPADDAAVAILLGVCKKRERVVRDTEELRRILASGFDG